MRVIVDMDDGEIVLTIGSERHRVLDAHFAWDGARPVMQVTHPLGDAEPVRGQTASAPVHRTMDSPG